MARVRQPSPDSALGFKSEVLDGFQTVRFSLGSGHSDILDAGIHGDPAKIPFGGQGKAC